MIALAHYPDAGRRVVQCPCERAARWSGDEVARLQGWRARWVERRGALVRVWACPGCYVPPPPARIATALPGYLRDLILDGDEAIAREQLELARSEPARWQAWVAELAALVPQMTRVRRGRWAAWLRAQSRRRAA